jgi:hypothetical protein
MVDLVSIAISKNPSLGTLTGEANHVLILTKDPLSQKNREIIQQAASECVPEMHISAWAMYVTPDGERVQTRGDTVLPKTDASGKIVRPKLVSIDDALEVLSPSKLVFLSVNFPGFPDRYLEAKIPEKYQGLIEDAVRLPVPRMWRNTNDTDNDEVWAERCLLRKELFLQEFKRHFDKSFQAPEALTGEDFQKALAEHRSIITPPKTVKRKAESSDGKIQPSLQSFFKKQRTDVP